jgi:hypothetical protein
MNMMSQFPGTTLLWFLTTAPPCFALAYLLLSLDARRDRGNGGAEDGQIGLKVSLYLLLVLGIGAATRGAADVLHYLLSGTKIGSGAIKSGIGGLLAGGTVIFAAQFLLLPRTNHAQHPRVTRLALGYLAAMSGLVTVQALDEFLTALIGGSSWPGNAGALARVLVFGGMGMAATGRLGALSGWTMPVRPVPVPPPHGYAPQAGMPGYPPQGGYPAAYPQAPAYPPQGGYPPAGGGPPPPAGGGPPPGGGFPPPGGFPPR